MQISVVSQTPSWDLGDTRGGNLDYRYLLEGDDSSPGNYHLGVSASADQDYLTPRHRHNFEQIRFPLEGAFEYGKDQVLPAGWVGYFPEGVYYGPQILHKGIVLMQVQFGGASGSGYLSKEQRQVGLDGLRNRGHFEKGAFTYIDDKGQRHRQDAYEAIWEQAAGRKLEYPEPRYKDLVIMNPANFAWIKDPAAPGVERKWLGTFTERELRVGFVKLEAQASFTIGEHDAPELLFLHRGSVSCRGSDYPARTAFGTKPKEGPVTITAREPSEFLYCQMPRF